MYLQRIASGSGLAEYMLLWGCCVSLFVSRAMGTTQSPVYVRHQASLNVSVHIRLIGISKADLPFDKLHDFLDSILPVLDLSRKDGGAAVDARLNFRYSVSGGSENELEHYNRFLKSEGFNDGNTYRIQKDLLNSFLHQLEGVEPTFQDFTVIIVHSLSLPKHLIYDVDHNRCVQSFISHLAFLDLSAVNCVFPFPQKPTNAQDTPFVFQTPIYNHPWPGTFLFDPITRWSPIPATDIINHRIARLGGVVASAARTFGSPNYASVVVDSSSPFFIPIICFQNGLAAEAAHFPTEYFKSVIDKILPPGHKGKILAVTYGVEELPETAIAIAQSRVHNYTSYIDQYGKEFATEYWHIDEKLLSDYLQDTVNKLVENMLHTLLHAATADTVPIEMDMPCYPIVVLSDFHEPDAEMQSKKRIQPLFSNGGKSITLAGAKMTYALHSTDSNTFYIAVQPSGFWEWKTIDLTNPDIQLIGIISSLISGITLPEFQQYESFGVMDLTWFSDGNSLIQLTKDSASLSTWSARRGVALARLNSLMVAINDYNEHLRFIISRLRALAPLSQSANATLDAILGPELRALIYTGLDSSSHLYPLLSEIVFPAEVLYAINNVEEELSDLGSVVAQLGQMSEDSTGSYESFMAFILAAEKSYKSTRTVIKDEMDTITRVLRSCTVSYDTFYSASNDSSRMLHMNPSRFSGIILVALISFVVCALGVVKFMKHVEQRAKKLA